MSIDFKRASFRNGVPILNLQSRSRSRLKTVPEKSVIDFDPEIDQRFSDQNRSAIEKQFQDHKYRRNTKSDPDFRTKIDQRF